ncbi:MAG: hypothetical protein AB8B65_11730 [Kordia sp.]|uniref:hypothetical protein n=1 Tax=Kordia sp. TaxID=1965332 RepID=UPI003859FBC8
MSDHSNNPLVAIIFLITLLTTMLSIVGFFMPEKYPNTIGVSIIAACGMIALALFTFRE